MAYWLVEFRENKRKKWQLVDECLTKAEAEHNREEYSKHIRRFEDHEGMAYQVRKVKGNLTKKESSNEQEQAQEPVNHPAIR
jgi:hypothetical protein